MIRIGGSVRRSFYFPANLSTAFSYYRDMGRIVHFLPHISLVNKYSDHEFRMLFSTTELHVYQVRLFCDFQVKASDESFILHVEPSHNYQPISKEAGMYRLTGTGFYSSESIFIAEGDKTRIDYSLKLTGDLPVPMGIRFMPRSVLDGIANSITRWRIDEIAEGFIRRSIDAFERTNHRIRL